MPYQTSGVVELHNLSQKLDIWAELTLEVIPWNWDERSLYFVPHWTAGLETEPGERWSNVTLTATQGRLVGQSLTVMNPVSSWWGGLNEILMLGDGETLVPLNAGDVFAINDDATSTFASPLLSRPRAPTEASGGHLGYTTLNRLMLLDAVPFDTGFNVSITANEHLEGLPDFGSLLYFYVTEDRSFPTGYAGYLDKVRSLTSPPVALDITNPIECESLAFQTFGQDVTTRVRELLPRAGGLWSAGADLFVHANSQGDGIELTIPAPNDRPASLTLYPSGGDAAGIVAISVNGRRVIDAIDLSARPPIALLRPITLGIHTPIDGHFTIRIEAIAMGENSGVPNSFRPDAMRYSFGLDCVTIVNPRRNVR